MIVQTRIKKNTNATKLIEELTKIHAMWTAPATIMMSLRGRFERRAGVHADQRVGGMFPEGDVSVLMVGEGGGGKTTVLKHFYEGFGLGDRSCFCESAGDISNRGLFDLLEEHSEKIIFMDEMDWGNSNHYSILKQVSSGRIHRQRMNETDPIVFSGMIIGATNAVKIPKGKDLEHLISTLDRFRVIQVKPAKRPHKNMLEDVLNGRERVVVDYDFLINCLIRNDRLPMTEGEKALVHAIWQVKAKSILDEREQYRNMYRVKDCVLFIRRILGINDASECEHAVELINELIDDTIMFNLAPVLELDMQDKLVYTVIEEVKHKTINLAKILLECESRGRTIERRKMHRILDRLIDKGIICKVERGHYSTCKPKHVKKEVAIEIPKAGKLAERL